MVMASKSKTVRKGDTSAGQNLYEGWYNSSANRMLTNAEVSSGTTTGLLEDGWYVGNFESDHGTITGYELYEGRVGGVVEYIVYVVYILKGKIYTEHRYVVHQQTEII